MKGSARFPCFNRLQLRLSNVLHRRGQSLLQARMSLPSAQRRQPLHWLHEGMA